MDLSTYWTDLSSNNAWPDLAAYKRAGHKSVMLKATEGTGYAWWGGNDLADQAHDIGLAVGRYAWVRPDSSAADQADFFLNVIDGHTAPGDWLMNDFELTAAAADPPDEQRAQQAVDFNESVSQAKPDLPLVIYTGNWYLYGKPHCQQACRQFPVVMSDYSGSAQPGQQSPPPNPYRLTYAAHQFTSSGAVPGVPGRVDYNYWLEGFGARPAPPQKPQETGDDTMAKLLADSTTPGDGSTQFYVDWGADSEIVPVNTPLMIASTQGALPFLKVQVDAINRGRAISRLRAKMTEEATK
jgi:GH25 family lysozyme M1 (1,4-beta-N-acetylmuramidase)